MVTFTPIQLDFSLVANFMNARINQQLASSASAISPQQVQSEAARRESAIGDPPWRLDDPDVDKLARTALRSGSLISSSVSRAALNSEQDSPKLFAAYEALTTLKALATNIAEGKLSDVYLKQAEKRISSGLSEVRSFLDSTDLRSVTLLQGEKLSRAETAAAIKRVSYDYVTGPVHSGDPADAVSAWAGASGFDITVTGLNSSQTVQIDLSTLTPSERTLSAVTDLINTQLETAGVVTRFSYTKLGPPDDNGFPTGTDYGFKIRGTQTERLSFTAANPKPAIFLAGASGSLSNAGAQISKWTDIESGAPVRAFADRLDAATSVEKTTTDSGEEKIVKQAYNETRFLATATAPDGSVYALAETHGDLQGQALRGDKDIALTKYDSTGKLVWTRVVGATNDITGAALAVASDGRVAIGGATADKLATDAVGGGKDGFVSIFDSAGREIQTYQRGSRFDDEVTALAFDDAGALYIGGKTKGSMGGGLSNAGGNDAYVEKLDANGERAWINQWGGSGDEGVTALTIDPTGGAVAATNENGDAVLRRVSDAAFTGADWSRSIGAAVVKGLAYDDSGALYASGNTRLAGYSSGTFSGSALTDSDAFAMRFDIAGTTVSDGWFTRFGGAGDQSSAALVAHNGTVYVAGSGETGFGSATVDGTRNAYIVSLDAASGGENWATQLTGRNGSASAAGIAIAPEGDSDLDLFGLPSGAMTTGDTSAVSDRTPARVGDHFFISVEGGRKKKITLEAGETYRSLTFKVNAALLLNGAAEARRGTDGQKLRITPTENVKVELLRGAEGKDLLSALGLTEGMIFKGPSLLDEDASSDAPPVVALGLKYDISLASKADAQKVADMLDAALLGIRKAYRHAVEDPTLTALKTPQKGKTGTVSAYQQAQLANFQAGLNRLQSGSAATSFFA